jgi:glycosyltransferase involved in cell wall biosynthesis
VTAAVDMPGGMSAPGGGLAGARGLRRPALVRDVELAAPVPDIGCVAADGSRYEAAWLLVRLFEEPIGLVVVPCQGTVLSVDAVCRAILGECETAVRDRAAAAGVDADRLLSGVGAGIEADPPFVRHHATVAADGPAITVVICTRNRPRDLERALGSLAQQSYERFRVLVVDNAPSDDGTHAVVSSQGALDERIDYTVERRPGLSWARNHALRLLRSPVVAWLDDDEVADRHWLMEIAAAFCSAPGAAAVSGAVVPAELETQAQLWFEQYGGHSKGRGFEGAVFRSGGPGGQSPLYPLPAFGVGANMAFDVAALRALGGFDTALGAGTATLGGEDTLAFSQLLLGGGTVVYRPSALTRHYHRPDYESLLRQMVGYGTGLTAYYASLLRSDWRLIAPLLRLAPAALRDTFGPGSERLSGVPDTFPRQLIRRKTWGMMIGPLAYLRARSRARALAKESW